MATLFARTLDDQLVVQTSMDFCLLSIFVDLDRKSNWYTYS
jgi:hypothetical protein